MLTAIVIPHDLGQPMRLEQLAEHDVDAYRRLIGGNLELVQLHRPAASVYLNEEGKLDGLPINQRATALLWVHNSRFRGQDVVAGSAILVGPPDAHGDDTSAPDDLVDLLFGRCARCGAYVYIDADMLIAPATGEPCEQGATHQIGSGSMKLYCVQVFVRGETGWYGNELMSTDWFNAYIYAIDLAQRWTRVREVRVVPDLDEALREAWYQLGLAELATRADGDPPFTKEGFIGCYSIDELAGQIGGTPSSGGSALYYRDLCFIQQVNGGDEWLIIRHGIVVTSMTLGPSIKDGTFASLVRRLLAASKEQLEQLAY